MRNKVEVIKQWITKTKEQVGEKERISDMVSKFMETFGFLPDILEWSNEGACRILRAEAEIEKQETIQETILGQKIEKVLFLLTEDKLNLEPTDWKFSSYSEGLYTVYKWSRKSKGVKAMVKIFVK